MNIRSYKNFILIFLFSTLFLSGCTQDGKFGVKKFKHNTPLIKQDVKILGKKELEKSAEMGPMPVEGDVIKLKNLAGKNEHNNIKYKCENIYRYKCK